MLQLTSYLDQALAMLRYEPREADVVAEFPVDLPMRGNVDGQGGRGWWDRHKLVRRQHRAVAVHLLPHASRLRHFENAQRCWTVCLTRIASDVGDDDNATSAMKGIRDAVATVLGLDDGDARLCFLPVQQELVDGLEHTRARVELWHVQHRCLVCQQNVVPGR